MTSSSGPLEAWRIPRRFQQLTRIPIVIYYGDNIPKEPSESGPGWLASADGDGAPVA